MGFLEDLDSDWPDNEPAALPPLDKNTEQTDDETIRLLRRIEKNTSATHFWTRVTGIPVLIWMIVFLAAAMAECSK